MNENTDATRPPSGDIVDVTIKGVRVTEVRPDGTVVIRCDDDKVHGVWPMPPQAAITGPGKLAQEKADADERISAVLAYLDRMEAEGYTQPYIAASVRKTLGLPPRHWPPQAGDVWHDGLPSGFFAPLWFAQAIRHETDRRRFQIVMVPMECGSGTFGGKAPEELLAESDELRLVYRQHQDGDR